MLNEQKHEYVNLNQPNQQAKIGLSTGLYSKPDEMKIDQIKVLIRFGFVGASQINDIFTIHKRSINWIDWKYLWTGLMSKFLTHSLDPLSVTISKLNWLVEFKFFFPDYLLPSMFG